MRSEAWGAAYLQQGFEWKPPPAKREDEAGGGDPGDGNHQETVCNRKRKRPEAGEPSGRYWCEY